MSDEKKAKPAAAAAKAAPYTVKKGASITSKRGIVADGAAVTADDFSGGTDALAALVKAGLVVKS
jgi:hypothetical protein